jgi:RimJ/RimL family protein N-acetyltransferase
MPKKIEEKLRKEAKAKGLNGDLANAYVYGTLQKVTNRKPGKKK